MKCDNCGLDHTNPGNDPKVFHGRTLAERMSELAFDYVRAQPGFDDRERSQIVKIAADLFHSGLSKAMADLGVKI